MKTCSDCKHAIHWEEYGNLLTDCGNRDAFGFIGTLDGVEDPAQAGCPHFNQVEDKHERQDT